MSADKIKPSVEWGNAVDAESTPYDWRERRQTYFEHLYLDQPPKLRWNGSQWEEEQQPAFSKPWITADQIKEITERNGTFTGGFTAYIIRNLESANTKEFAEELTEDEACALCMAAGVPYETDPITGRTKFDPCGLHKQHGRWTVVIAPITRFPR
jgi:hypothetical protein